MNRKLGSLQAIYNKNSKNKASKLKRQKLNKLPAISLKISSNKLASEKPVVLNQSFDDKSIVTPTSQLYKKYQKLKSLSKSEDYFEKLCILSEKNQAMRNNSISIQQKLIEINSSSKLHLIKETGSRGYSHCSHIDLVLKKYEEDIKERMKMLEKVY